MNELPSITASSYSSSAIDQGALLAKLGIAPAMQIANAFAQVAPAQKEPPPMSTAARIVKVFVADPNDNLPLDKRVLHTGSEQLTDLTDQELFFEVPITEILARHNAVRAATVDRKQAEKFGRDIMLEPARIRDLKMVVVTIAQF